ncbi:MAG: immunoglobulin domain-containing protein [Akkermansiaceae bacterium]|nr:immunoglobulin domain-containing protein [Akkermansiaceae bacterium]
MIRSKATVFRRPLVLLLAFLPLAGLQGQTINVDLNNGSSNHYTGAGIVPGDAGTTWNNLDVSSSPVSKTITAGSVKDSAGGTLAGVAITIASSNGTSAINRYATDNNTTPNPNKLMRDYTFSGTYDVTVTGLSAGTYEFWFFGHGDQTNQTGSVTIDLANGGGSGTTADSFLARDLINGGDGISYLHFDNLTVDSGGTFQFQVGNFLNGFQLRRVVTAPPVSDPRPSIFVDAGDTTYAGTAVADVPGTSWNKLSSSTSNTRVVTNVIGANGATVPGVTMTVTTTDSQFRQWGADSPGNPNPLNLMRDYFYNGDVTVDLDGLPEGNYYLYVFAHGDQANQNSTVTVATANGGGSGTTDGSGGNNRDLFTSGAEGFSYLKFTPAVGVAGSLSFAATGYFTGFQLVPYPAPVFTIQPPPSPGATLGSDFTLAAAATGPGTLVYQWRKDGADLSDGPSGNGSTYSGADTDTLTILNVQSADDGDYELVVTGPGGSSTSDTASLVTTASPLPPSIFNEPSNTIVHSGDTATFVAIANGTSPLTYVWHKDGSPVSNGPTAHGSVISGAGTAYLSIAGAKLGDAGVYHVVVSNSVDTTTSATATLTVNQEPGITTPPDTAIVSVDEEHTLTAGYASAFPPPTYQWQMSTDGRTWTNVTGGNSGSLSLTGSLANSGFYRVKVSNSQGSATSDIAYFGIASTQVVTFAPGGGSTNIAIDQPLRLVFPGQPKLGHAGVLRIHDAADDSVVATIDRSAFQSYQVDDITIVNAATDTRQGAGYFHMPIAIFGNEVWVSLSTSQRLDYGKSYYVTMDAALILDSTNAAVPGIVDPSAWRFSTKSAGPAAATPSTGPETITVAMDGAGDFATVQGAADWVPQNNTLPRTIAIAPGIYHEAVHLAQNRRFLTIAGAGATRDDVVLFHPCPATSDSRSAGIFRISCDDVTIRNLTLDSGVYLAQPNPAVSFGPPINAFPGRINMLLTYGDRLVFENTLVKAGQDTVYANTGTCYFTRSEIWGSVDFIYGEALAVFDDCDIVQVRSTGGPVTAPATPAEQPYGEVFLDCRFPRALTADGYPYDVGTNTTTFMRPWRKDGHTAIINCELGSHFTTKAWAEWGGRETTCRAREYGSTLTGGGAAPSIASRRSAGAYWLNTYDPDYDPATDNETTPDVAPGTGTSNRLDLTVDPNDYTLAAIFGHPYFNLGGWMPALAPWITSHPASATVDPGNPVTFSVVASGSETLAYQWMKNGAPLDGETDASLTIASVSITDWGTYSVLVTNTAGDRESTAASLVVNDPEALWAAGFGLDPASDGAAGEDPDADGFTNRMEFFFGGNPSGGDAGGFHPLVAKSSEGPEALVFEFDHVTAAAGVPWQVEFTGSLDGSWQTAQHGVDGVTIVSEPGDPGFEHVTVTIPAAGDRTFARLSFP